MIRHLSYVACGICGNPAQPADDAEEARGIAAREGFSYDPCRGRLLRDLCKSCTASVAEAMDRPMLRAPGVGES